MRWCRVEVLAVSCHAAFHCCTMLRQRALRVKVRHRFEPRLPKVSDPSEVCFVIGEGLSEMWSEVVNL